MPAVTPSLFGLLAAHARARPTAPFLSFVPEGDGDAWTWSYRDALETTVRTVAAFRKAGLEPGSTFVVCLENRPFMVMALLVASASGAVVVYADKRLTERELGHVLDLSGARLAFGDAGHDVLARAVQAAGGRLVAVTHELDGGISSASAPALGVALREEAMEVGPADVVELLFTSGSTSRPKAVMLTNRSLHHGASTLARAAGYVEADAPLIALPLSHAAAQIHQLLPTLVLGGRVVLVDRFSARRFFEQAARHGATTSALFAAPLRMLLMRGDATAARASSLRHITFGQSLTGAEYAWWDERFGVPLQQLWGMTETSGLPLMSPLHGDRRLAAMGRPVDGYEVAIRGADDRPVAPGAAGELTVRAEPGVNVALGYHRDPEATALLVHDGWLQSGDVARADDEGYYHFLGRGRDIIRRAGMNFSALEVEEVIRGIAGVLDVAVVGLPDDVRDERVVAFVVRDGKAPTEQGILMACAALLADYKHPEQVEFVEDLPRTAVGKVQKHHLTARSAPSTAAPRTEIPGMDEREASDAD